MRIKYKILIHVFFWIYILNQALFPYYINKVEKLYFLDVIIYLVTGLITFYSIYFYLPFLFTSKNKLLSISLGMVLLAFLAFARVGIEYFFWKYIVTVPGDKPLMVDNPWIFNSVRIVIIYTIYSVLIRLAIDWYEAQKLKTELLMEKQSSELALLRSQVNPHFLFNTLNNIYSLVYRKSDDAPAALMKLSSIMRYMLYDANTDKVMLEKEIEYLQSFIELQKLRLKKQDYVELNIRGDVNAHTIAPMLLIPFVENAFKHGSKNVTCPGIRINIFIDPQKILFEVSNYHKKNVLVTKDITQGIGMNNIKRRLELLYPGKHSLDIKMENDIYSVKLILEN